MNYFDRICAIDITPDIRLTNFKIKFEIKKNIISDKNSCRIDIYNLNESTRSKISNDIDSLVRVEAGYTQNAGLVNIGQGNISNVIHEFKRPDIITYIYIKDGFKAVRNNVISLSFIENTPLSSVINALIAKINLPIRFVDYDKSIKLKGGYSFIGSVSEALDQLGEQFSFNWSIQNGEIQILNKNKSTGKQIIFLSSTTGLVDNPEEVILTKDLKKRVNSEYKVVSLLQPQIEVGDLIQIESKLLNGQYKINELEHKGDTRGNEWYTTMTVVKNG
jgi:hypothetical protein